MRICGLESEQDTRSRFKVPVWSKEFLAQLNTDTGVEIKASPNGTFKLVYRQSQFRSEFVKAIYLVNDRLNQPIGEAFKKG